MGDEHLELADLGLFLGGDERRINPRFIPKGTGTALKILSRESEKCRVELMDGPDKGLTVRIYENVIDFAGANHSGTRLPTC